MTQKIELDPQEWGQVMQALGNAPWVVANPLLMKIAGQLRTQATAPGMPPPAPAPMFDAGRVNGE